MRSFTVAFIAATLLTGATAHAEEERSDAVQRRLTVKLTRDAGLDEATAQRVASLMAPAREQHQALRQNLKRARENVRTCARSRTPDEAVCQAALDELEQARTQMHAQRSEQWNSIRGLLTPSQQARVLLTLEKGRHGGGGRGHRKGGMGEGRGFDD